MSDDGYRKEVRKALEAYSRTQPIDDAVFDTFARGLFASVGAWLADHGLAMPMQ